MCKLGVFEQIEANQKEFERIGRSWWGHTPWGFRRQYRLCKVNESLFSHIGINFQPFTFEEEPGLLGFFLRKFLGIKSIESKPERVMWKI